MLGGRARRKLSPRPSLRRAAAPRATLAAGQVYSAPCAPPAPCCSLCVFLPICLSVCLPACALPAPRLRPACALPAGDPSVHTIASALPRLPGWLEATAAAGCLVVGVAALVSSGSTP